MPVLPLVGSMITEPGPILPSRSAASTMDRPMRSFTLESGFRNSHLPTTVATQPSVTRFKRTSGVRPTSSVMSLAIRPTVERPSRVHWRWGRSSPLP